MVMRLPLAVDPGFPIPPHFHPLSCWPKAGNRKNLPAQMWPHVAGKSLHYETSGRVPLRGGLCFSKYHSVRSQIKRALIFGFRLLNWLSGTPTAGTIADNPFRSQEPSN